MRPCQAGHKSDIDISRLSSCPQVRGPQTLHSLALRAAFYRYLSGAVIGLAFFRINKYVLRGSLL